MTTFEWAPGHPVANPRRPVLLLGRPAVAKLLLLLPCIEAVEAAFRVLGEGRVPPPGTLGHLVPGGGFHVNTGTAIQDVAAAALAYERAVAAGRGFPVDLAG